MNQLTLCCFHVAQLLFTSISQLDPIEAGRQTIVPEVCFVLDGNAGPADVSTVVSVRRAPLHLRHHHLLARRDLRVDLQSGRS
jgi:hypothetical protein